MRRSRVALLLRRRGVEVARRSKGAEEVGSGRWQSGRETEEGGRGVALAWLVLRDVVR